jgi:uncharacterized protein YfaS (alpha-2-macroglobulin family)
MKGIGKARHALAIFAIAVSFASLVGGCAGRWAARPPKEADPTRVEAHSSGLQGASSPVKVVFTQARGSAGAAAPAATFRFDPPVSGKAFWDDERSLVFMPERPLVRGSTYRVDVDLGLLEGKGPGGEDYFSFTLRSAPQRVEVETSMPRVARDGGLEVEGTLRLADGASDGAAESALRASVGSLSWRHETERVHRFVVSGIALPAKASKLVLAWNGGSVGGGGRGSTSVTLPAASSFELLGAKPLPDGAGVELAFSRALDRGQDLRGLVSAEGALDLDYAVSGSTMKLYAKSWPASAEIRVERGLRDAAGATLAVPASATVSFNWEKPSVRFLTKGNILPTSQGLIIPVETMNLSALVVEAYRVYGDNMLQFLQVNDLDGKRELKRVGEAVWRKTIDLGWKDDWKNRWVRHGLDIAPLLDRNKDGMFQIRLTFRRDHIRYVCPEDHDFKDLRFPDERVLDRDDEESSFWDYAEDWADGYGDYYKYKNDPCHPAFYLPSYDHDISQRRNVVVSDIGAALKRESDGTWHAAASDLRSTKPLAGALVTLYSYQRRVLASGRTASSGIVVLKPTATGMDGAAVGDGRDSGEPYFATVQSGAQTSWLKVDSGSALAVGHFDVGGEKADSGLKGFIYGERGVWRPGDPIHLTFVLYDRSGKLPAKYPVSFELEDPLGRIVRTGTYTDSVNGFYAIETETAADAPTGTYLARVRAGGRVFSRNVKVETIMPNRLKIALDWGGSPYISADTEELGLSASWLTGAQAGALKADVSATFKSAGTSFTTLPDYTFDDPTREASAERALLFEGNLGDDGTVSFPVSLSPEGLAPGMLKANVLTRVFEPSGVFSSETATVDFHPYSRYVGLRLPKGDAARGMLLTDTEHRVDLALVDRDGKLVKGGANVEVALYKIQWRWWWEKGEESLAERAQELYAHPIKKESVAIGADGRGFWKFSLKYPEWGRFLVRVEDKAGGHAAGKIVYIDWPGWAGKGRDSGGASAMLELSVGKPRYSPGERVAVSFPSNEQGRALATIERSGHILREEWIETRKGTTLYEFDATPDMAPNVYVHITFVQPHLQTANDLPIRLYGVVPVMVEDPSTRLKPIVEAPPSIAPGSDVSFSVREERGRSMTYTVAVVDEGLLGITRYRAPDPWDEFYRKEASALESWDLYQYVAGAFSGKLETLLAVGGSDEGLGGGDRKPSRFPPVVYYFPPRTLRAGETRRESFTMGQYIGAVRFMVIAGAMPSAVGADPESASRGAAFGVAEKEVPVRTQLMAQLTAPRVLSPSETAAVPATVFSFLGKGSVELRLAATGALSVDGPTAGRLDFERDGDRSLPFQVRAAAAPGRGRLVLTATANGATATQAVDLEIRSVGIPVSAVQALSLAAGERWSGTIALPGSPGTNSLSVELSRLRSIDLADRIDYLVRYPHGCAEQTTSAAFPQLYLPKAVELEAAKAAEAKANVAAAIERLRSFQTARGGFAFWPGQGSEDDWLSSYVVHFLLAASREGFDVPAGLVDPALDYLDRAARSWNSNENWSQSVQAYRLYDLAVAGKPDIAAMNRFRDFSNLPGPARFRLAAAYALSGMRDAARSLVAGLSPEPEEFPGLEDYTYGTAIRERAVVLDALVAMGDADRALPVYNKLAEELDSRRWLSTQDLGAALGAALPYAMMAASRDTPEVSVSTSGWQKIARLERPMARLDLPAPAGEKVDLALTNSGRSSVYVRVASRGVPPAGLERAVSEGLSLSLRYLDMSGNAVDPGRAAAGSDLVVEATVRNRSGQALKNLALTQLLPSGWEIMNYRVGEELPKPKSRDEGYERPSAKPKVEPLYDYQDQRDDRVLTYFSLGAKDTKVFRTYVNKAYAGDFFLPATSVQAMYDERFQAVSPGRWLSGAMREAAEKTLVQNAASSRTK